MRSLWRTRPTAFCLIEMFLVSQNVAAVMYIMVYVRWNHWLSIDSGHTLSSEHLDALNALYTILKGLWHTIYRYTNESLALIAR